MKRPIHQILVGANAGDAITSMALEIQAELREDRESNIYARFVDPSVALLVSPLSQFPDSLRRRDLVIYHASYGSPEITKVLLELPSELVLVYHNITPARHFMGHDPQFALGLQWGRHELELIRNRAVLAVAVSRYNADELAMLGYSNVRIIAAGLDPERLCEVVPEPGLALALNSTFPDGYVLAVSQLLPHKRFDTVVEAMHFVQWVHGLDLGLVIVGANRMPVYAEAITRHARQLNVRNMQVVGGVSERALATYFRLAKLYLCTSAHEGLALPPLEAMSLGIPVVARAAGAVAETIGDGGLVLPENAGSVLVGEAVAEIATNVAVRRRLIRKGFSRVQQLAAEEPTAQLVALLETVQ